MVGSLPARISDDVFEDMARRGAFARAGRVELRGGVIVQMSPVLRRHAFVAAELARALDAGVRDAKIEATVLQEVSVRFGGGFQPTCDVVVCLPTPDPLSADRPVLASETLLIVEVADTSLGDDLGGKLADYASAGLAEYWVADVSGRLILQHCTPSGGAYRVREPQRFGAVVQALTLPLTVDTRALAPKP